MLLNNTDLDWVEYALGMHQLVVSFINLAAEPSLDSLAVLFKQLIEFGGHDETRTHMTFVGRFSYHYSFRYQHNCCLWSGLSLNHSDIITVGCGCKVSTLKYFRILARDYHVKGFPVLAHSTYMLSHIRLNFDMKSAVNTNSTTRP